MRTLLELPFAGDAEGWLARVPATLAAFGAEVWVAPGGTLVYRVSIERPAVTAAVALEDSVLSLFSSPDGGLTGALTREGCYWWDGGGTVTSLWSLSECPFGLSAARFSPDGSAIAVGGFDLVIAETGVDGQIVMRFPEGGGSTLEDVAFTFDGRRPLGVTDSELLICELDSGEARWRQLEALDRARACVFSGDGSTLAVGTADGRVVVAEAETGEVFVNRTVSEHIVWSLALNHTGRVVAYVGANNRVTARELEGWSVVGGCEVEDDVHALSFTRDGRLLLVAERVWPDVGEPHGVLRLVDTQLT